MLNPKHSYKAYSKTDVNTSDQLTLIIMLYDGLLRFLKKAMVKIEENDVEAAHNYFVRSIFSSTPLQLQFSYTDPLTSK